MCERFSREYLQAWPLRSLDTPLKHKLRHKAPGPSFPVPSIVVQQTINTMEKQFSTYASHSRLHQIPQGNDITSVRTRQSIIRQFYTWWAQQHPEKRIHNTALNEDIYVTYNSKQETSRQAAYRYQSTLAVLQLDYILENALPILSTPADPKTKAQKRYERMLIMKCDCPDAGLVKLTVGVYRNSQQKEQYCITVIDIDFAQAFRRSNKHQKTNRR